MWLCIYISVLCNLPVMWLCIHVSVLCNLPGCKVHQSQKKEKILALQHAVNRVYWQQSREGFKGLLVVYQRKGLKGFS